MHSALGPERRPRPNAAAFFERALVGASLCGVTRLADVTGLDRLGLPVWQAVRPAGKSLSVHQGKGASPEAAKIGALCEAIEAHCAENAPADGPLCRFSDLAEPKRAPELGDYCRVRNVLPGSAESIQWCRATDLLTGKPSYLPHDLVSIDYTRGLPNFFERVSSGLGAGASEADALPISLFEAIERDAVGEWQRMDPAARFATSIQLHTVPFEWFQSWRIRFASLDIEVQVFRLASIVGIPVFMCVIGGVEEFGSAYRRFYGTSAHGDPEVALFKALAEAIQSRLTLIAGVRDDIMPSYYAQPRPKPAAGGNAPGGREAWREAEPVACSPGWIAERLAARGYRQIAVKRLDDGLEGVAVTKAFIPGLGSSSRTRRAAP
ncbi:MAG TPA: YcaO-like family protein [Allosphingosinicella sp.]|nr:YcaO-like family protein [Allosphingosinicella sp.]